MADNAAIATNATTPVQQTVNRTIVKKPYSKRKPLGLLKLSRQDLINIHKMFTDTIQYKDFNDEYVIITTFEFVGENGGIYSATFRRFPGPNNTIVWFDEEFCSAIADKSDIVGFMSLVVYANKRLDDTFAIGLDVLSRLNEMTNAIDNQDVPAALILSDSDAKFILRPMMLSTIEEINRRNTHLEHLQNDVINYLGEKRTFSNKFIGFRSGLIISYFISAFIFVYLVIQETRVPDVIETFLLLVASLGIGFSAWFIWRYTLLKYNHVVFKSEKPGIYSAIRGFYERNKLNIENGLITLFFGIILAIIAWALGLIRITL